MIDNRFNSSKYVLFISEVASTNGISLPLHPKKSSKPVLKPVSFVSSSTHPAPLRHCVTMLVSLCLAPPQSVIPCLLPNFIWLALYYHLPCPLPKPEFALPPATKVMTFSHCITASPCVTTSVSQSFALPPATKPVSHLPCPLPPNQSVIWLPLKWITTSPHHHALHHHITMLVSHLPCPLQNHSHLPCPLPPNQSVNQTIHLTCPLPPRHRATASSC